jgi:RecB family exonuclease
MNGRERGYRKVELNATTRELRSAVQALEREVRGRGRADRIEKLKIDIERLKAIRDSRIAMLESE